MIFYRYVKNQQPKVFIIENVKGLLSDNNGRTFQNWCQLLGQSMNTHYNMFNHEDSLLYNLHYTVLNSKDYGVPQNRERVFLIGIRNDLPNTFRFPKGERLKLRLKDILEPAVDEKYYLSEKLINGFLNHKDRHSEKGTGFIFSPKTGDDIASCLRANAALCPTDNTILEDSVLVSKERRTEEAKAQRRATGSNDFRGKEITFEPSVVMNCLQTGLTNDHLIMVKEATVKGYAIAGEGDSINFLHPNSETRKGRVGKGIANTIDTGCNQAVVVSELQVVGNLPGNNEMRSRVYSDNGLSPTITAKQGGGHEPKITTQRRIRRLTPLECWRLQGFPDSYFHNAAKITSDSQLYKQAGNSMTTKVMKAIIGNLLPVLNENKVAC
jgi:DNA (cytosine-5)-methyltransferase 1